MESLTLQDMPDDWGHDLISTEVLEDGKPWRVIRSGNYWLKAEWPPAPPLSEEHAELGMRMSMWQLVHCPETPL